MAFSKKTYTSGQTPITADNLNAIQDELIRVGGAGTLPVADYVVEQGTSGRGVEGELAVCIGLKFIHSPSDVIASCFIVIVVQDHSDARAVVRTNRGKFPPIGRE